MTQWLFNPRGQTGRCEMVSDGPLALCELTDVLNETDNAFCFLLQRATQDEQNLTQVKVKNCEMLLI